MPRTGKVRTGVWALLLGLGLLLQAGCAGLTASAPETGSYDLREGSLTGGLRDGIRTVIEDAQVLFTAPLRMDRRDALLTGGALALVGGSFAADQGVHTFIKRNSTSTGREVALGFTDLGNPATLAGFNTGLIAIGAAIESSGGTSALKQTGLVSLEAELFSVTAAFALNELFGRARPGAGQGPTHFNPFGGDDSFPSEHAVASFAVAAVLADRGPPAVGWLAYGVATAVSASRIYRDDHFLSDVVAGSLLGWGLGKFFSRLHPPGAASSSWEIKPVAAGPGASGVAITWHF